MKKEPPKYVVRLRGAGGHKYLTFKRRGEPTRRFKCQDIQSPAFWAEYATILNRTAPIPKAFIVEGLIAAYYKSTKFESLAERTKADYTKYRSRFEANAGKAPVAQIERKHVIAWRDQLAKSNSPHFANYWLRVTRVLFEYGKDIGEVSDNPAKGVQEVKYDKQEPKPWPRNLIKAARKARPYGDRTRLLFELLYCTGQRVGDVLKLKWTDLRGNSISIKQNKTKVALLIPITAELKECLRRAPRDGETILTAYKKITPWSYRGASDAMMTLRREIGAEAHNIHAIRHTVASEIGAAGSDDEIASVTGHTTKAMVAHYAGAARQQARAKKAQKRRK